MNADIENEGRYDDLFSAILQQEGKMEPFLDHAFNFLFRRTDFFITMKTATDKMGFPPGKAEMMVREAFKKYETKAKVRELRSQQPIKQKKEGVKKNIDKSATANTDSHPETDKSDSSHNLPQTSNSKAIQKQFTDIETVTKPPRIENEESKAGETQYENSGDTYNGGVTDKYSWSQTVSELDIQIPLPSGTKAKNVNVLIKSTHLRVAVVKPDQEWILIDGDLPYKVLTESSMWLVESGSIHVSLDKAQERMWGCVIEGEKEIDLTKVEALRDMSELDSESQAAVNRVIFDQHQKMQGKPQSHELQTYGMLEKAWDAEGSPFKGTPFDPSRVNISNSSNNI